jgi:hypothetical protein
VSHGATTVESAALRSNPAAGTDLEVFFDIKPTSCPNPFNPNYPEGFVESFPTAILGTDSLDTGTIQISSLLITVPDGGGGFRDAQFPPLNTSFEDVAAPLVGGELCECTTDGPDGYIDLTMKFDSNAIAEALGDVVPGQEIPLCISGTLIDGTPFIGCDCIIIVGPVAVDPTSWGTTTARYR